MANFTVNEKSRTISVEGTLNELEREIIGTYVRGGYTVKAKKIIKTVRLSNIDIEEKLKENHKEIYENFETKKKEKITDKNGIKRKAGFLIAMEWLKTEHYEVYDKMMEEKEENKELTNKRQAREIANGIKPYDGLTYSRIKKYLLEVEKDTRVLDAFDKKMKDNKANNQGFPEAVDWFKTNYDKVYEAIKDKYNKDGN
jgi:hypothetical protein